MADDRATAATDHLQAAALELIEAARAFLDVLEELVTDRERLDEAVDVVGAAAGAAARLVGWDRPAGPDAPTGSGTAGPPSSDHDYVRVPVS